MGYSLHIERLGPTVNSDPKPILFEEWRAAVVATEGVRLHPGDAHILTNPQTGKVITIPAVDGDADVFFPEENTWYSVFHWHDGSASFRALLELEDASHPIWAAAVALASRLDAVIRGDDGEVYDFLSGEIV